jgi:hypothetical protein
MTTHAAALHAAREKVRELEGREQTEYVRLCVEAWRYHIRIVEGREEEEHIAALVPGVSGQLAPEH